MTLDANEKVYQADLQKITPNADAMIYGTIGNWILRGMPITLATGSVTIGAGSALLQGRLYELSSDKTIDTSALPTPYFVGLSADLSKTNTDAANNQYTFVAQATNTGGNLRQGDIQAFIPIWKITDAGITQLIFDYEYDAAISTAMLASGWSAVESSCHMRRIGRTCVLTLSMHKDAANAANIFLTLPESMRPSWNIFSIGASNSAPRNLLIHPNGECEFYITTPVQNETVRGELTWMIDQH